MNQRASAALLVAASKNDLALVQKRLAQGADVNARPRGDFGCALYQAIRHGNRPMIALLLKAGADVNLADREGYCPLWLAASKRDAWTAKRLLDLGARTEREPNPLEAAVTANHLRSAQLLLQAGAKASGRSLLVKASWAGSTPLVNAMLEAGLRPELRKKDPNGWTPLLAAISNRHWEVAEALLAAGAQLESKVGRWEPLELALERGGVDAIRRLRRASS